MMIEHIAIVMRGNLNWAEQRGLGGEKGSEAGERAARDVVSAAAGGITDRLTLFGSSGDWPGIHPAAERLITDGSGLQLHVAFDYSGRDDIAQAASRVAEDVEKGRLQPEEIGEEHLLRYLREPGIPDVDLLILTGGERNLGDCMLWQIAYAEIVFLDILWPDFKPAHLEEAVQEFARRERKFGAIEWI